MHRVVCICEPLCMQECGKRRIKTNVVGSFACSIEECTVMQKSSVLGSSPQCIRI